MKIGTHGVTLNFRVPREKAKGDTLASRIRDNVLTTSAPAFTITSELFVQHEPDRANIQAPVRGVAHVDIIVLELNTLGPQSMTS